MKLLEVAVGIVRNAAGQYLVAQRPTGKPYAGWWEFPGGKVETNESVAQALERELLEELGIHIREVRPWQCRDFVYPHAHVRLHFMHARSDDAPQSCEAQAFCWGDIASVGSTIAAPFLPASLPILRALQLPEVLYFTAVHRQSNKNDALKIPQTAQCIVVHEPNLGDDAAAWLSVLNAYKNAITANAITANIFRENSVKVKIFISSRAPQSLWGLADGVHLTERDCLSMTASTKPSVAWLGASCHSRAALEHAAAIGCDYATLSPVLPTQSHADTAAADCLGWAGFAAMVKHAPLAVYALGGMQHEDVAKAHAAGAQGVAMKIKPKLSSNLPLPQHHPFQRGKPLYPHRASGVEFIG